MDPLSYAPSVGLACYAFPMIEWRRPHPGSNADAVKRLAAVAAVALVVAFIAWMLAHTG